MRWVRPSRGAYPLARRHPHPYRRHRGGPAAPTANGIAFLAVEDDSGIVNVMLYPEVIQTYRRAVMSRFLIIEGEIRRDGAARGYSAIACSRSRSPPTWVGCILSLRHHPLNEERI